MTVGISCINLLSIYLDYELYLLFALATTMLMVNKDYQLANRQLHDRITRDRQMERQTDRGPSRERLVKVLID